MFLDRLTKKTDDMPPPQGMASPEDATWRQHAPPVHSQYPSPLEPTRDERYLHYLLHPSVPDSARQNGRERLWLLKPEAVKHLQLTMFPDQTSYHRFKKSLADLMRIANWDADDYLQERQLKLYAEIMGRKSIGWTPNPRERDAINENRMTNVVRDDRTPPPRESHGFLGGLFGR